MRANHLHYSVEIQWDDQADIFVVTVPELPGCLTHGKTYEEAVRQGQDAIESVIATLDAIGRPLPAPRVHAV